MKLTLDDQTIIESSFDEPITDGKIQLSIGTSSDSEEITEYLRQGTNIAVFLNNEPLPADYEIEVNRFVFSDVTTKVLLAIITVCAVVYLLMLVYMIIKYKEKGAISAISIIGYIAILLIALRYANVNIVISGLATIIVAAVLEYLAFMKILSVNSKETDEESKRKEINHTLLREAEMLIPLVIIAVVFTLARWEPIYGVGMVLFWAIAVGIIFNIIPLKIMNIIKNK